MSARLPRHRAEPTTQQRRHEAETVLGLITFVVCLGLLIWMATAWQAWPMAIGLTVSGFLGAWWHEKRQSQKKAHQNRRTSPSREGNGA